MSNSYSYTIKPCGDIGDIKVVTLNADNFKFEYGYIVYERRFTLDLPLDAYVETALNKCIRMGIEYKYKTVACDKLIAEMQILYRDEFDKVQCLCLDLHDYTFTILHKGDMTIKI